MRTKKLAGLLVVACLMPVSLAAEDAASPAVGDRVRVRTGSGQRHAGELLAWDDTNVELKLGSGKSLVLPRRDVAQVDVSTRRGRKGKGALIGAGVAAGIVAVLGLAASGTGCYRNEHPANVPCPLVEGSTVTSWHLVAAGVVIGALVAPGERWEAIPSERVRVSLAASRSRGVGATVSFSF
jgi:hypothetical protein